jgi:hypothetical protein
MQWNQYICFISQIANHGNAVLMSIPDLNVCRSWLSMPLPCDDSMNSHGHKAWVRYKISVPSAGNRIRFQIPPIA